MLTPDGEVTEPDRFLPVAEKFGLICDIDKWVITHGLQIAAGRDTLCHKSLGPFDDPSGYPPPY